MSRIQRTGELCEFKQIEWKITNFYSLSGTRSYDSPTFAFYNAMWHLTIYPGGIKNTEHRFLSILLERETECPYHLTMTLSIKKADGTLINSCHAKITKSRMCCLNFYDRSILKQNESELLSSGILTIHCTLKLNQDGKQDIIKTDNLNKNQEILDYGKFTDLGMLSENLRELLTNEDSCDIVLEVKEKKFKAHKAILMARSPVFAAMFQPNTLESRTGVINIIDCDPESFQQFLEYLYCGKIENISFYNAFHLYGTANKYDVQNLKEHCVESLIENLTSDNVCEVVILADKHDDKKLASAAQDFFTENFRTIFETTDWDSLMQNDYRIAKKLLTEMSKVKGSR